MLHSAPTPATSPAHAAATPPHAAPDAVSGPVPSATAPALAAELPADALAQILARLPPEDLLHAGATCRGWRDVAERPEVAGAVVPQPRAPGATGVRSVLEHVRAAGNLRRGRCERRVLAGHTHRVEYVCFSPDGRSLASASSDHTGRLWDAAPGTARHTLAGHTSMAQRGPRFPILVRSPAMSNPISRTPAKMAQTHSTALIR